MFEKNFHRIKIEAESYLRQLVLYIHFNPVKHGLVDSVEKYPWSSYYLIEKQICTNIQKEMVEEWFDGLADFIMCHKGNCLLYELDKIIIDE